VCSIQDLKSWELIQDALAASGFIDADWRKVLEVARVRDARRITPEEFEEVFDEVLARAGFAEEDHVD
jgi:restriction endonuclease Mrr